MRDGKDSMALHEISNTRKRRRSPISDLRNRNLFLRHGKIIIRKPGKSIVAQRKRYNFVDHGPNYVVDIGPRTMRQVERAIVVGGRQELVEVFHLK